MNNNKARDIFYGIVAVATLIVAIIGATLAYFSVTASSNEGAVNAQAAVVSIQYFDGQQVSAQGSELIPADFKNVVKKAYERHIVGSNNGEITGNKCIDTNLREVCSVYRFSIENEVDSRTIIAYLNSEYNGFTYLHYAVYDVTAGQWLELNDDNENYLALDYCNNDNEIPEDDCWVKDGNRKTYSLNNPTAMNSMFGYTNKAVPGETTKLGQTINRGTKIYDLVLFIKNEEENQNIDQGQNYRGTISIEILDGGIDGAGNGNIQGEWEE